MESSVFEETHADVLDLSQLDNQVEDENLDYYEFQRETSKLSGTDDVILDSNSEEGVLDIETVKTGLTNLGKTPDGITYAMLTLKLVGLKIKDADVIRQYQRLQEINLSNNFLTNIDFLESMKNLISITLSHNLLNEIPPEFCLQSVEFLREIDFSFNKISSISDLGGFYFLSTANFDGNNLTDLNAFVNCSRLTYLNVAHNQIESLEPLFSCPLRYLDVSYNRLNSLAGLEMSTRLQELIVSGNDIRTIEIFSNHHTALHKIDLEKNSLMDVEHLRPLQALRLLRELNLRHNPIIEVPDYRYHILIYLEKLTHLDGRKVDVEERVKAENIFQPTIEIMAARDHRINVVNRFFKAQTVLYSTLQNSFTPYPMLVLVGPKGSGKKMLARKLVQEIPSFFGLAISHTDQPKASKMDLDQENEGMGQGSAELEEKSSLEDYYYVSTEEFDMMRMRGKFLETCIIDGYQYGLTIDTVENIAREGLACVTDMEIEGVASLKKTHFEPRYVLTVSLDRNVQESRIREKAYSPVALDGIVKNAIRRVDTYIDVHRSSPGYFDKVINTEDLDEAFLNLKRLVMDYLGITDEYVTESRTIDANSRLASIGNLSQSRASESRRKGSSGESMFSQRGAGEIEQKSLERRLNTARAAIFRKSNEDSMSSVKLLCRAQSYDNPIGNWNGADIENGEAEVDTSSQMSNHASDPSEIDMRPVPQADGCDNDNNIDKNLDVFNRGEDEQLEMDQLNFSQRTSSSNRSLTAKAPREIEAK